MAKLLVMLALPALLLRWICRLLRSVNAKKNPAD